MQVQVRLVVTMTNQQAADYAAEYGLPLSEHAIAAHVREWTLSDICRGPLGDMAEVTLR